MQIAIVVYPGMTALDAVGPYDAEVQLIADYLSTLRVDDASAPAAPGN